MAKRTEAQRAAALDELIDKAELYDIGMRYMRAIDRVDRALLLSLYHDDAIDNHGNDFTGPPPAFADYCAKSAANLEGSAHYITSTNYRIDGDTANGELYFIAYHRTKPPENHEIIVCGRYLDVYHRRNGAWKIFRRNLVWDSAVDQVATPASMALLRALGEIAGKDNDLSYKVLPLMARGK